MNKKILIAWVVVVTGLSVVAGETGKPFMSLFPAIQTGGHSQNWAFAQDDRGIIYVGNGYGIQEFDGSSWRMIRIPNGSFVRSFAKDSAGRIFVGSASELGYLGYDQAGSLQFKSLLGIIPPADRSFNFVWSVHTTPEGVFFQAREKLFLFGHKSGNPDAPETWTVKVWNPVTPENYFVHSFYLDRTLYVLQRGMGLMKKAGDSLLLVPGSRQFGNDRIHLMLPFPGKTGVYLLGTLSRGLFLFDGKEFRPFPTEADDLLQQGTLYDGKVLPDGTIALGTLSRGFIIIDTTGNIRLHLLKETGLLSNAVPSIFVDREKNVWLGMSGGIGILEYNSGLTQFPVATGGVPFDLLRYQGVLFASATDGVYYLDTKDSQFKYVTGMKNSGASNQVIVNGRLYVANASGVYLIDHAGAGLILPYNATTPAFICLHRSRLDSSLVLGGSINGLSILRFNLRDPRQLNLVSPVRGVHEYIRQMIEPVPGTVWLSTYNSGIIRLQFDPDHFDNPEIKRYGPLQGLPVGITSVFQVADRLVFGTGKGVFIFDEKEQKFKADPFFRELNLGYNPGECVIASDKSGNVWANAGKETAFYFKTDDGRYGLRKELVSRFANELIYAIYPENPMTIWFGTTNGVVRYLRDKEGSTGHHFPALIRRVKIAGDSVIYSGGIRISPPGNYIIPHSLNQLTFEYAATYYIKPGDNEFRTILEGFDRSWSPWNKEIKRNYTNLPHGKYIFRLKARNISGEESSEASFAFSISTPWYQTVWAYAGYVLIFFTAVFLLVRLRTRTLRAQKLILEKTVKKRTFQIRELSRIGRDITSSLTIENIIQIVYENIRTLMDVSVFSIGLKNSETDSLDFPFTIDIDKKLPSSSVSLSDSGNLATWCFNNKKEIIINDFFSEYRNYTETPSSGLAGNIPESILFIPLIRHNKEIGVITAQSFSKNAYTEYHLNMVRNLAAYSAVAMENAEAYTKLTLLVDELKVTQDKLITQSKLAALGTLTAGIAHEIKNPLNFVNNFAALNAELAEELEEKLKDEQKNLAPSKITEIKYIIDNLKQNSGKIREHGRRADSIVQSMLHHSRGSSGELQFTNINALLEEAYNLTYHGLRAQNTGFNISIEKSFDNSIGKIKVLPQELSRAFLNLISNACYAAYQKKLKTETNFVPTLILRTKKSEDQVIIIIRDNGNGIPQKTRDKIFTPFFTTKPAGQGTGLGLSVTYDIIVHQHKGQITFETEEGNFTEFEITLPILLN